MWKEIAKKIAIALIAALVFSALFAYFSYTPEVDVFPFGQLFQLYFVLSAPVYLLAAVPVSMLLDRYWQWPSTEILAYAAFGAISTLPYALFIFPAGQQPFGILFLYGASAAIVFYFVLAVGRKLLKLKGDKK